MPYIQDLGTLCHYAFLQDLQDEGFEPDVNTSHVALKCLANVLLLETTARQQFVDLGYARNAAKILNVSSSLN